MTSISRTSSRWMAAATAALALTFGSAYAAAPGSPGAPAGPGGWHEHGGMMMMPMGKQLEQLHSQLKLTPAQEQQWQSALTLMKQNHEAERANHEKLHQRMETLSQQSVLDLNAMHAAHEDFEQQNHQLREQTTAAWLALYNGLDDQQKMTVSTSFKQHLAQMRARHEKMHQFWQQHGGAGAAEPKP
ncbi:periplasmic heavy metal sensor [Trinickia fusca]|uniref:periplasmic heavy metal sensor n=1 Tax=Trinickia fusca TaxID=2419777 RepID=UPI0016034D6C|nr:periplasmic heavy metal sensor [Trinickia fusca]